MAVRDARDPQEVRAALTGWMAGKLGSDVALTALPGPAFSGFSNETFLFDVAGDGGSFGIAVRLEPAGHAYLVVGRNLGADSLHRWLAGQGWPVTRLAARSGYRLLQVDYQAERAGVSSP